MRSRSDTQHKEIMFRPKTSPDSFGTCSKLVFMQHSEAKIWDRFRERHGDPKGGEPMHGPLNKCHVKDFATSCHSQIKTSPTLKSDQPAEKEHGSSL